MFVCLFVCLFGFFFKQIGSKFEWRRNNKRLSYLEGIKKGRKVKTQFKSISNTTKKPLKSNKFFREPVTYFFYFLNYKWLEKKTRILNLQVNHSKEKLLKKFSIAASYQDLKHLYITRASNETKSDSCSHEINSSLPGIVIAGNDDMHNV